MFPAVKPHLQRAAVVGGVAAGSLLLLAGTASAHVTVQPPTPAPKGGSAVIDFKVPNERDDARTSKLEVDFPTDQPMSSVMPEPVPGWKIDITTSKLAKPATVAGSKLTEAVSRITWTAEPSAKIPVGEFQMFPVALSGLPTDTNQIVFKALQTYDDKEVVRWIEVQQPGQPEPPNPAPVLNLAAASTAGGSGTQAQPTADRKAVTTTASPAHSTDTTARVLGVVGIVVGAAGVAFGVLAGRRRQGTA